MLLSDIYYMLANWLVAAIFMCVGYRIGRYCLKLRRFKSRANRWRRIVKRADTCNRCGKVTFNAAGLNRAFCKKCLADIAAEWYDFQPVQKETNDIN